MTDFDPSLDEGREDILRRQYDIHPALARALDRVPDGWAALWCLAELRRIALEDEDTAGGPEEIERVLAVLSPRGLRARSLRMRLTQIERELRYLRERGLHYDFQSGTIRGLAYDVDSGTIRARSGRSGRPGHLLNRLIEALFEALPYKGGRGVRNSRENREQIAKLLAPFFAGDVLDQRRGRLIHRTIRNYLRR